MYPLQIQMLFRFFPGNQHLLVLEAQKKNTGLKQHPARYNANPHGKMTFAWTESTCTNSSLMGSLGKAGNPEGIDLDHHSRTGLY
jgi:hypothetical protein